MQASLETSWIYYFLSISAFVLIAGGLYMLLSRSGRSQRIKTSPQFPGYGARLGIIEKHVLDYDQKLILIRRDHTEHLLFVSPETISVIETGITPPQEPTRLSMPPNWPQAGSLPPTRQDLFAPSSPGPLASVFSLSEHLKAKDAQEHNPPPAHGQEIPHWAYTNTPFHTQAPARTDSEIPNIASSSSPPLHPSPEGPFMPPHSSHTHTQAQNRAREHSGPSLPSPLTAQEASSSERRGSSPQTATHHALETNAPHHIRTPHYTASEERLSPSPQTSFHQTSAQGPSLNHHTELLKDIPSPHTSPQHLGTAYILAEHNAHTQTSSIASSPPSLSSQTLESTPQILENVSKSLSSDLGNEAFSSTAEPSLIDPIDPSRISTVLPKRPTIEDSVFKSHPSSEATPGGQRGVSLQDIEEEFARLLGNRPPIAP